MTIGNPKFDPDLYEPIDYVFDPGLNCDWDDSKSDYYVFTPEDSRARLCSVEVTCPKREGSSEWRFDASNPNQLEVWVRISGNHHPFDKHGAEIRVRVVLHCYKVKDTVPGHYQMIAECPNEYVPGSGGSSPFEEEGEGSVCEILPGDKIGNRICYHWVKKGEIKEITSAWSCGVCYNEGLNFAAYPQTPTILLPNDTKGETHV